MRIFIFQPALPEYRIDFFQKINKKIKGKLKVFYSSSDLNIKINAKERNFIWAFEVGKLIEFLPGLFWQKGILKIDISEADIVVVCGVPRNIATIFLLIKAKILGIKTIWWGHYWSATSNKIWLKLRMLIAKLSYSILFYTDYEVEEYLIKNYSKNKKVGSLNNGINNERIIYLRKNYDFSKRKKNILFIGRVTEKAKLELLIEALKNKMLKDYRLDIIGEGEMLNEIKNKVNNYKINKRVVFHKQTSDEEYISKIANKAAFFVYPGSVGLSLIHAMTYGLPVIIHNNRSHQMPEFAAFEDSITGLSFNEESINDLTKTIMKMMSSGNLRNQMSFNALRKVSRTYNTDDMNKRFYKFCSIIYKE